MIVQFRNEKVSNHGSIPITIDCNIVAFIVFEEGFHQPIKRTKQYITENCPSSIVVTDAHRYAIGPGFESRERHGCLLTHSACVVWERSKYSSSRKSYVIGEGYKSWKTLRFVSRVSFLKLGVEPS
ncbi:hypothetical protein TNCV_1882501 [Trichonephila clavipes]|nr:hypothetical protein TNCV_1882501 [Trichonephila clavipes]